MSDTNEKSAACACARCAELGCPACAKERHIVDDECLYEVLTREEFLAQFERSNGPAAEAAMKAHDAALRAEVERLREALEFYADPKNWQSPSTGFAAQYDPEPSPVQIAGRHEFARRAIEAAEGGKK